MITSDIFQRAYKQFPNLVNTLHSECLRQGCFLKRWERVKVITSTRAGKEDTTDPSTFRPISLIYFGGEVLEKNINNQKYAPCVNKQSPESQSIWIHS